MGTAASSDPVATVLAMAVVGFLVLFGGIAAPQIATASTAALLTFVLPVAVTAPVGAIGPRLLGWVLAAACSIPTCLLVWPTRWHDDLRRRLSAALGRRSAVSQRPTPSARRTRRNRPAADVEVAGLRTAFSGTPYPPTGASARAVALAKLVGRTRMGCRTRSSARGSGSSSESRSSGWWPPPPRPSS